MNKIDPNYFECGKLYRNDLFQDLPLWQNSNGYGPYGTLHQDEIFLCLNSEIAKNGWSVLLEILTSSGEKKWLLVQNFEYDELIKL